MKYVAKVYDDSSAKKLIDAGVYMINKFDNYYLFAYSPDKFNFCNLKEQENFEVTQKWNF